MRKFPFLKRLLIGVGLSLWVGSGLLWSAETENVDIHVSLNAVKSLTVNTTTYDFGAMDVNTSSVSATPIVVTNNSTALIETYTIQATNAISDAAGTDWTLDTSTGTNQFSLGAQFSDTRPNDDNTNWTTDALSTSATTCTESVFGNGTLGESGQDVLPSGARSLWFRLKTPSSVSDSGPHTITVTISVL